VVSDFVVNLLGNNIGGLKYSSKEVCLGVNTEKTKYILTCGYQNSGESHKIKRTSRSFENVRFPVGERDFPLRHSVQIGCAAR
jgi:hypothetical protein